jgi:pimeloyl-ACP methyl ester carboxylesterase
MATFALIPGAGGEAWYWHLVAAELEALGHRAIPVELPAGDDSAGWAEYSDAVVDAIGDAERPTLVAQSLAGFTAPMVTDRVPIAGIVLLNAMIPAPDETGGDWWANTGQGEAQRAYLKEIGVDPKDAEDEAVLYFHDVPLAVKEDAFHRGEPSQSMTPMTQPWPLDDWPDVPTRVLAGRLDRLFPAEFQRRVARDRLGLPTEELDGGHLLALSRPTELVDRLLDCSTDWC